MKRLLAMLLALCLCLNLGLTALAAEGDAPFENAGALYQSWYEENPGAAFPYPACVNGVRSTDGGVENLTFYLVQGTSESDREALLALVEDKGSLTFAEGGAYPIAELWAIQEAVTAEMAENGEYLAEHCGLWGVYIDEADNCVVLGVDPDAEAAGDYIKEAFARYGDRISVEEGGLPTTETATVLENAAGVETELGDADIGGEIAYAVTGETLTVGTVNAALPVSTGTGAGVLGYWPLIAAVLCAAGVLFALLRRRPIPQPAEGEEGRRTDKRRPAPLQVETAVMLSAEEPDAALREQIRKRVEG